MLSGKRKSEVRYALRHLIPDNLRQGKLAMSSQLRSLKQVYSPEKVSGAPQARDSHEKLFAANS